MSLKIQKMPSGKFRVFRTGNGLELFDGPKDEARDETGEWTDSGSAQGITKSSKPAKSAKPSKAQAFTKPTSKSLSDKEVSDIAQFTNQFAKVSEDESDALKFYAKTNGCEDINGALRGTLPNSPEIRKYVDAIDSAISKTKIDRDIVSYRGVSGSLLRRKIPVGDDAIGYTVSDKAFTSTSLHAAVATDFNAHSAVGLFSIKVPKGSNAAYVGHRGEYELLLGRDSTFKITGYKQAKGRDGNTLHIYDAELI